MPRLRHVRLAVPALVSGVVLALAASGPFDDQSPRTPLAAVPQAAGAAAPHPPPRVEPYAPKPDAGRIRDETGLAGPASPAALIGYAWPLPRGRLTNPFGPSPWGS